MTSEIYSVSGDFPNQVVQQAVLNEEIEQSTIFTLLIGLNVVGDVVTITFDSALSGPEMTTLDSIVANHQGIYDDLPEITQNILTENIDGIGSTGITIEGVLIDNGLVDGRDISADFITTNSHIVATSGVHGVVGNVVGTSDAQTLSNKTLTTPIISSISNTGTLTLPTSTDTLVGRATTDTLTNKTINADNNTITNIDNNEIKAGVAIDTTKLANGTVSNTEFQKLDGILSAVVGITDVQTLTNKTINADNNTITNIDNNEIKAGAAIDATKIANGSISNAEFQQLDGVTSSVVSINNTQTLTNKTLIGATNTISASQLRTTGADVVISGAAPPTAGQVLQATSATVASWTNRLPFCASVTAVNLITTTSTTHILATSMSITPTSGSYAVTWSASVSSNAASGLVFIQIFAGGVLQGSELRFERGDSSTDNDAGLTCVAKVAVNGSQAIEGRWRQTGGTGEIRGRNLMIIQVAP